MITLRNLKLHNFLSHEDTELSFEENQKLLIDGNSGSGKSSILEAIIWAFYGTGRSSNTSLIRRGADKATVELTIDNDGSEVVIKRSVTKTKHSIEITIDGVSHPLTGVRELQNYIETELTGASYTLFVNSIAYLQGGAESFVGQNAGARKELLLEIIKTIDFDTYYERVKVKINEAELTQVSVSTSLESSEMNLQIAETNVEDKASKEAEIAASEEKLAAYEAEKATLEKKLEGRDDRKDKLDGKKKQAKVVHDRILEIEAEIAKRHTREAELDVILTGPAYDIDSLKSERVSEEVKLSSTRDAIANVAKINAERAAMLQNKPVDRGFETVITALGNEIEEMGSHNECPQGDTCPNFAATMSRITAKKEEKTRIEAAYEQYKKDIAEWQAKFDLMQEIPVGELQVEEKRLSLNVSVLDEKIKQQEARNAAAVEKEALKPEIQEWINKLAEQHTERNTLVKELEELTAVEDSQEEIKAQLRVDELNALMTLTKNKIKGDTQDLGIIKSYEEKIPVYIEEIKDKKGKLAVIETNLKQLALLKDAFGSKGIRALVIDYIIPELEEKINEILSQMSEFRVILDTQQEKASGDGNKEGLFITIVNDMGEEMPFENYSGGEKLKIVVAITEALATLQKCGFRLFDETWVGLDEVSLESFSHVLDTLLDRFPQVICVSHLTEIKSAFENSVKIIKHNGISHVE